MTRYEIGFMGKCAEYGLDAGTAVSLLKAAKDDDGKTAGKIVGGTAGGIAGLLAGTNAKAGFEGLLADPMPKGLDRKIYNLGDKLRQSMIGSGRGDKLRKLLRSPKGKIIAASLLGLPLVGGAALGTAAGHGVDKLRE